jgi:hypothetical protein
MPEEEQVAVTPIAKARFNEMIDEREQVGIKKYGQSLMTHNGRDALLDAEEEVLDLWQYLNQARLERDQLLREIAQLKARLGES